MQTSQIIRRRKLPHWDVPTAAYFVTVCLEGSIPAEGLLDIRCYRAELERRHRPAHQTQEEWELTRWKLAFGRTDQWLVRGQGARFLEDERLARIVVDALHFFAGEGYDLLGYVVMPSHLHWVFQPLELWVNTLQPGKRTPREHIVHSIDRFTAFRCNHVLGRRGAFWQREPYDHWIRSPEELERILLYVEGNPVKAGLVQIPHQWPYSSAWERHQRGLELGQPLTRPKIAT